MRGSLLADRSDLSHCFWPLICSTPRGSLKLRATQDGVDVESFLVGCRSAKEASQAHNENGCF